MQFETSNPKVMTGCVLLFAALAGLGLFTIGDFLLTKVPADVLLGGGLALAFIAFMIYVLTPHAGK